MNFDPKTKSWIQLIALVIGTGSGTGYTAFLTGSSWQGALIVGLGTAATHVWGALSDSPKDKAEKSSNTISPVPPRPSL